MENLNTILDFIRYAASEFVREGLYYGHGTDNALDDAAALVIGCLELPFAIDSFYLHARLTNKERELLKAALRRRIVERVPSAYISKRTSYGGYEFYIDERALIPRSPIFELVERGLDPYWDSNFAPGRVLDLCCGSGCIGILAKLRHPESEVVLADLDEGALAVAEKNLALFAMQNAGIEVLQSDLFAKVDGRFDWILCNPPYVEEAEMKTIAKEYHHEPYHALVSGRDGLDLVRKILYQAPDYLTEDGVLILEVGMSWQNLEEAYPEVGFDWVDLQKGGEGVLAVSCDELLALREAGVI